MARPVADLEEVVGVLDSSTSTLVDPGDSTNRAVRVNVVLGGSSAPTLTMEAEYVASNPVYIGFAAPGSLTSAAVWQIQKITYDGSSNPTVRAYANSGAFTEVWDNRAALVYA